MFENQSPFASRIWPWAIGALALLSLIGLVVTSWIWADFGREQEIVGKITKHLPNSDLPDAKELAGELRLQSRLTALLILNLLGSAITLGLLVRSYLVNMTQLRSVQVLATDILASLDQSVITVDCEGKILSVNPCGKTLLGMDTLEPDSTLAQLPKPYRALDDLRMETLRSQTPIRDHEYVFETKNQTRFLRTGCNLLHDHQGNQIGVVIHILDVSEKALIERRLRRMERYMGLGSLAAGLQHEIKNPLAALSLHVQLLAEALEDDGDEESIQESLEVLRAEVRRVTNVLESFREYASVAELHRIDADLVDLLHKLVRLTDPQAKAKGIQLKTIARPSSSQPDSLHAPIDSDRIEQVLLNLILNSFTAMADGGKVVLEVDDLSDWVAIRVIDEGCGIPKDLQDKVFDPYFTTRSDGTGMGLAISEKIVRQHGGRLEFETGIAGTTFSVLLPKSERALVCEEGPPLG
ncbi:PAS domain S-box protein [Stieleria sp. JC731]|uniref:two-component system sensor histidine kinase NtrB n=1 Tax=Pirellulaceae TaxID=2691357 RepID=UPI001E3856EA|nr:ATP-binding protein [Stieleria sp. JC731]MCC9601198.1 PAS domain S-box protein [Stieleria sp. JC731]